MAKHSVLVVDDSIFMRKIIGDLIESDNNFEVIGKARNGNEALDKIRTLDPDIVTLDIEMPCMNGLECLYHIMNNFPRPVIMLSALNKKNVNSTFKAIELGAVDFILKPSGSLSLDLHKIRDEIILKLKSALKAKIRKKKPPLPITIDFDYIPEKSEYGIVKKIVVIASSTGGPRSLLQVLSNLPISIDCPILIVQHMSASFTKSFSERLNSHSVLPVSEGKNDEIIQNGQIYLAPGNFHMTVIKDENSRFPIYKLAMDQKPYRNGVRPNANYLFESASAVFKNRVLGVVLTGMGKDGALGSKLIKNNGGYIITESESTCVVFGMPKMAAPFANIVSPLGKIPGEIINFLRKL